MYSTPLRICKVLVPWKDECILALNVDIRDTHPLSIADILTLRNDDSVLGKWLGFGYISRQSLDLDFIL